MGGKIFQHEYPWSIQGTNRHRTPGNKATGSG